MPNATGSDISKAGDYKVDKLMLLSGVNKTQVDIRGMFTNFEVYEDIFSPYITAKIFMNDSLNLTEMLPIRGQETVEMSFKSDILGVSSVTKTFKVYKIDRQIIDDNGRGQQYVLHLMSEGGYYNYTERCGYSVKGAVSNMVLEVFKKHFPEYLWKSSLFIEPTADNFVYTLPQNYSPFKAISWLSRRAISGVETEYSPFLFYETMDGYRFKSLSQIMQDGESSKDLYYFVKDNVNRNPETNEGSGIKTKSRYNFPGMYFKLQGLVEQSRFDMVENIGSGIVASKMSVHDLMHKEKRDYVFKEEDIFEGVKKLGSIPHYVKSTNQETNEFFQKSNSAYSYIPSTPYTVWSKGNAIVDNIRIEEYFLRRKYIMSTMQTQRLVVDIYGDSTKRVGQLMEIFVPKIAADGHLHEEKSDKNLSGDYMITSICHKVGLKYTCSVELSRNAKGI